MNNEKKVTQTFLVYVTRMDSKRKRKDKVASLDGRHVSCPFSVLVNRSSDGLTARQAIEWFAKDRGLKVRRDEDGDAVDCVASDGDVCSIREIAFNDIFE